MQLELQDQEQIIQDKIKNIELLGLKKNIEIKLQ